MDRAREYLRYTPTKHNIIFDTKGMYNDILNDKDTIYNCVRNKVKKNKIISYSGKSNCLCCNEPIVYYNDDYVEGYNDRFNNCGAVVCEDCNFDYFHCDLCNCTGTHLKFINITMKGKKYHVCERCVRDDFKICPDCGKIFYAVTNYSTEDDIYSTASFIKISNSLKNKLAEKNFTPYFKADVGPFFLQMCSYKLYPIFRCNDCNKKDTKMTIKAKTERRSWTEYIQKVYVSNEVIEDYKEWEPYFFNNLKSVELADGACI
jgi:hypothetical protein